MQIARNSMTSKKSAACTVQAGESPPHRPASSSSSTALTCRIVLDGTPRSFSLVANISCCATSHPCAGVAGRASDGPGRFAIATPIASRRSSSERPIVTFLRSPTAIAQAQLRRGAVGKRRGDFLLNRLNTCATAAMRAASRIAVFRGKRLRDSRRRYRGRDSN